jgi:hypothetical protein
MEAFNFTAANEDCNLYTYDMRKLDVAACVHNVGGGELVVAVGDPGPSMHSDVSSNRGRISSMSKLKVLHVVVLVGAIGWGL